MSNALFGVGVGISTCGDFTCAFCNKKYNEGNDKKQRYDGDSIPIENFAGLDVCGDCFSKIEMEILGRMPSILEWYKNILEKKQARISEQIAGLSDFVSYFTKKADKK